MATFRDTSVGDADRRRSINVMDTADSTAMTVTGLELTNAQPMHVAMVDGSGNQIISFGGGTQYAEGTTTAPATGTLALGRYDATPPTLNDGEMYGLQFNVNGELLVDGGTSSTEYTDGGTPPANPIGPTLEWNEGGTWRTVSAAKPLPTQISNGTNTAGLFANGASTFSLETSQDASLRSHGDTSSNSRYDFYRNSNPIYVPTYGYYFNGSDWDRIRGDATNGTLVNLGANNDVTVTEAAPTTLVAFSTDIPNAGTRVQLASNAVVGVVIQAKSTNTGVIYVGGATVSSTVFGAELQPGQSVGLAISNTDKIYVDTATNGNDVSVLGSGA